MQKIIFLIIGCMAVIMKILISRINIKEFILVVVLFSLFRNFIYPYIPIEINLFITELAYIMIITKAYRFINNKPINKDLC
ncbi:hypothetical protein A1D24_08230 [Testudinibacter aquarius]|nr:hypothetical protein A1D24_08230 [Testudinibacter aquarius]